MPKLPKLSDHSRSITYWTRLEKATIELPTIPNRSFTIVLHSDRDSDIDDNELCTDAESSYDNDEPPKLVKYVIESDSDSEDKSDSDDENEEAASNAAPVL